jgi:hypothetical protein
MRRTVTIFLLALLTAAALSTAALAKEGGVELSSVPTGIGPGEPWTTELILIDVDGEVPAKASPGIQITNVDTGQRIDYPAEPTSTGKGVYTVEVVFPEAGTWGYSAYDGVTGRMYEYPPVEISGPQATAKPPTVATKAPSSAEGGFPLWPLVVGLTGFAVAAAAAVVFVRRRALRPSHLEKAVSGTERAAKVALSR